MKVITNEMKALIKTSPFYLMMMVCAEESGCEETPEAILAWEAQHMPKFRDLVNQEGVELPREAQLMKVVISPEFDKPFEADTVHGMIDEFLARVEATPELVLTPEETAVQGSVYEYYTKRKAQYANV
jgi:hypothetical protein